MQFIYDNLTASVISGTVVLILFTVQMRAMNSSIAQTGRNVALNRVQTFATWLEQDLQRVGRNRADDEDVIKVLDREKVDEGQSPTDTTLSTFSFCFGSGNCATPDVTYQLDSESRTVGDNERTVYQLTRTPDGQSPPDLGYFDLQFVDENATVVGNPQVNRSRIRAIRVHFSVITPFQNEESTLEEVHRMVVVPYTPAL